MIRFIPSCLSVLLLLAGCNRTVPSAARSGGLNLTPGFEAEYEGELTFGNQWGTNKTPDTKYFVTIANLVLEKTADGYRVVTVRNVRESLAPAPPPGGAAAPVNQDFHVLTLNLAKDGTRGFPRPAQTIMDARITHLNDWYLPPLVADRMQPGAEWPWQERLEITSLRVDDCRTRYRITGREKAGGQDALVLESSVDARLPFQPNEPMPGGMTHLLTEFKQRHWMGFREPWLLKYERIAHTEQPTRDNKLITRYGVKFELKRTNRLSAGELKTRREQLKRLEEIQNRRHSLFTSKDVRPLLDDAKKLTQSLDQQMFELLKGSAQSLVTQLQQRLSQAELSEKMQREQAAQQAASKAATPAKSAPTPTPPRGKGKGKS